MGLKISPVFLLPCLLALAQPVSAQEEIPNPGPRSDEEAKFLDQQGSESLAKRDFKQAARDLKRRVDRYPSLPKTEESYLGLLTALLADQQYSEVMKYGQELVLRRPDRGIINQARAFMAEAALQLKQYLSARTLATELLDHEPAPKQKALAYSVRFQTLLEEKQYQGATAELDRLREFLDQEPVESFQKMLPAFKMSLITRQCITSHLLKDKTVTEEETLDYFSKKNLCFKSALPLAQTVLNPTIIGEWCESFTFFDHELQKLRIDPYLKEKIGKDLKATFDFAKGLQEDLVKCYAPYQPPKSKKRTRKSRRRSS
jgi:tetratricopeptide (TPR) repeat protein